MGFTSKGTTKYRLELEPLDPIKAELSGWVLVKTKILEIKNNK